MVDVPSISNGAKLTLWRKLVAGSNSRKTRLHDESGRIISLDRALRNTLPAYLTGAMRLLLNKRPEMPWISYDGQALLGKILKPSHRVLEFGSGMSTIWYARHAGHVTSIEDHEEWYGMIGDRLRSFGNVDYHFARNQGEYIGMAPDEAFDLVMIDGKWRDDCARFAIAHLAPGGVIYLDNSDRQTATEYGNVPEAARLLREFAGLNNLPVREFTDFAPTQFFVQGGLMVGGPAH